MANMTKNIMTKNMIQLDFAITFFFGNYWVEMGKLWGVDPIFKREMKDTI